MKVEIELDKDIARRIERDKFVLVGEHQQGESVLLPCGNHKTITLFYDGSGNWKIYNTQK